VAYFQRNRTIILLQEDIRAAAAKGRFVRMADLAPERSEFTMSDLKLALQMAI
jgi:hypothetical protein